MNTNIKNLSKGLLAAAFGLTLVFTGSAFKTESNANRTQYTFRFNDANHSEANVEDESKWVYDATDPECDEVFQQACLIKVDAAYVNAGATPTLKSTLNIAANPVSLSNAYVAGSADGGMEIQNRTIQ